METRDAPLTAPLGDALRAQRGRLFLWAPVMLASGIGAYLALPVEPGAAGFAVLGAVAAAGAWLALARPGLAAAPLAAALAVAAAGVLLAAARAHMVAAPVLEWRHYGPVEGRIVGIDRSISNVPRVTLDRVTIPALAPDRTPARVRISLHARDRFLDPRPGLRVMVTAHLSPPAGPVEPGGFNFRRKAWFERLGAVGYARAPMLALAPPERAGPAARLFALRMGLSWAIRDAMPGREGGFATAILTGDRSAIDRDVLDDLRATNLAHLLAISGLHMGLLTGFVFGALRGAVALVPPLALRIDGKKLAAAAALPVAFAYLLVSGASVASERAFVMVAVMLLAVLFDRRALTLRSVAAAALVVLAFRPESLSGPGFQMSFAATTALVAVFGWVAARRQAALTGRAAGAGWRLPGWLRPVTGLVLASLVAGAATAPVAAFHFNRVSQYGLIANLASVPMMGFVVMPAAVVAAVLAPLGLAAAPLAVMRAGIAWILGVAEIVADWEGAVIPVTQPAGAALPLLACGALFALLWRGRFRWAGLAPVAAAAMLWAGAERPALLVSEGGGLWGAMGPEGRALSRARGEGFAALSWLENDGDPATQEIAAARDGPPALRLRVLEGEVSPPALAAACASADVVLAPASRPAAAAVPADCLLIDRAVLARRGALAVHRGAEGPRLVAAERPGARPWSRRPQ